MHSSRYSGYPASSGYGDSSSGSSGSGGGRVYAQLQNLIDRATNPHMPEPNMALNLEVADLINAKKANAPREAATEVLRHVNSRNTHESMLALHLLDTLVKNCGYPMHLQVSTKDFLNELVRRFPEREPVFPPPPMKKILELIHEWKNTLCVNSKHKEDLTNIRDMHRLLGYKGYRFGDFDRRAAAVLTPSDNLKSPDELEEEDRAAQAAKLQELIRRGTPKDLAAAQELMKIMSGAQPDKKPDYAMQTAKELAAIQHRVLLLNEMLDNSKPNERLVEGDAFHQIAVRCRNVQPKIQKWITQTEEGDDNMDKLLLMNDLINNVLNRYEAFKKGDRTVSAEINPAFETKRGKAAAAKSAATKAAASMNLIDFDEEQPAPSNGAGGNGQSHMDDLSLEGLSMGSSTTTPQSSSNGAGMSGLAGLSFSSAPSFQQPPQQQHPFYAAYQNSVPASQAQQSISWGNLTNTSSSSTQLPAANQQRIVSPSQATSSGLAGRPSSAQAGRPATPAGAGAINLGASMGAGTGSSTSPSPYSASTMSYGGMQNQQQQASAQQSQPAMYDFSAFDQPAAAAPPSQQPKKKDPFEDLLL